MTENTMYKQREKLIELIEKGQTEYYNSFGNNGIRHNEYIADRLLANGVIVPPCKVGDVVYKISRNKVKECEVVFIGISADEKCSYFNFIENYADGTFYKSSSMVFGVIGKTVFLSREDAEKALENKQ